MGKRGPNAIRTERYFAISNGHARLRVLPVGEDEAIIVEARLRRPGDDRYHRARHLELTAPVARMKLPAEAVAAIERKRGRLPREEVWA